MATTTTTTTSAKTTAKKTTAKKAAVKKAAVKKTTTKKAAVKKEAFFVVLNPTLRGGLPKGHFLKIAVEDGKVKGRNAEIINLGDNIAEMVEKSMVSAQEAGFIVHNPIVTTGNRSKKSINYRETVEVFKNDPMKALEHLKQFQKDRLDQYKSEPSQQQDLPF